MTWLGFKAGDEEPPSPSELAMDQCQRKGCRNTNEMPHSDKCEQHATPAEREQIEAAQEAWREREAG